MTRMSRFFARASAILGLKKLQAAARLLGGAAILTAAQGAQAMCFDEAGQMYEVNADLLRGIAQVESSMNPLAMNMEHKERTGSYDIGLMQINSGWLKTLAKFGITEMQMKTDPCLNVKVGAWILKTNMNKMGANWNAVGAYNAACTQLKGEACTNARNTYTSKVWRAMNRPAGTARTLKGRAANRTPQYAQAGQVNYAALQAQQREEYLRQIESRKRLTRVEIAQSMPRPASEDANSLRAEQ